MSTAYISHPDFMKHEMGRHHPECPERIAAIEDQLIQSRLDAHLKRIDPPLASEADITRVHSEDHLAFVKSKAPSSGYSMIDGDTIMNPATWTVSLRAAGAAIAAVDAVMQGEVNNAFCAIRPRGIMLSRIAQCNLRNLLSSRIYQPWYYQLVLLMLTHH